MILPDSLIFDMDGTLWDNVHTYAVAWNKAIAVKGYEGIEIGHEELGKCMGKEISKIVRNFLPDLNDDEVHDFFTEVDHQYKLLVPSMHPHIYDGVLSGLEQLSKKYKLFLLSNCEKDGLVNFMNHTKTRHLIVDYMEHGMTLKPKHHNLRLLIEKHGLQSPVYIGDTDADSKQSEMAGIPFIFVSYGFGYTEDYTMKFDSFIELTDYFYNI